MRWAPTAQSGRREAGVRGLPGSSLAGPLGLLVVPHVSPTRGKLQGVVDPRSPREVQGPACSAPASNPGLGGRASQWARSPRPPQEGARWRGRRWGLTDRNPKVRRSWYLSFNSLCYLNLLFFRCYLIRHVGPYRIDSACLLLLQRFLVLWFAISIHTKMYFFSIYYMLKNS
jgi:hypothetical protein